MKKSLLIFLLIIPMLGNGQAEQAETDSIANHTFIPPPGIYLSYDDFIHNRTILPEMVQTELNPESADFYDMLRSINKVKYLQNDSIKSIKSMWGYSDGKAIHLNRLIFSRGGLLNGDIVTNDNSFIRLSVFGNISLVFFVKNTSGMINPYGYQSGRSKPVEILFDTRSGKAYKATLKNLENLMIDDSELLAEFRKDKDEMDIKLYMFIKKYNERHPFTFIE